MLIVPRGKRIKAIVELPSTPMVVVQLKPSIATEEAFKVAVKPLFARQKRDIAKHKPVLKWADAKGALATVQLLGWNASVVFDPRNERLIASAKPRQHRMAANGGRKRKQFSYQAGDKGKRQLNPLDLGGDGR